MHMYCSFQIDSVHNFNKNIYSTQKYSEILCYPIYMEGLEKNYIILSLNSTIMYISIQKLRPKQYFNFSEDVNILQAFSFK